MADQQTSPPGSDIAARRAAPGPAGTPAPAPVDGADTPPAADEIAELRARVAELEDRWRRALADFDNLRKRVDRESGQQRDDERARVAAQWLPVLDNLDLALEHAGADPDVIIDGVRAVRDQALNVLAKLGFPRQSEVGRTFDAARHEAVAAVPDPRAPAGTILHVLRPGYGNEERQLRPAAVVVAKGE